MDPEEAREKLIESLREVHKRFDDGADDWQYGLLRTFRQYSRAIGIERELLDPLEKMLLEAVDETFMARRRQGGETGTPLPLARAAPLTFAAACVTVLKERGQFGSIPEAELAVARISGIERKKLKGFRDNINRGKAPAAAGGYPQAVADIKQWHTPDILDALKSASKIVK